MDIFPSSGGQSAAINSSSHGQAIVPTLLDEKTSHTQQVQPFDERKRERKIAASFPWLGIGALLGCVLLIVLAAGVLLVIEGPAKVVSDWTRRVPGTTREVTVPKPASWLSAILSAISVLLHIALTEGLNISWWYRVRQDTATVGELHEVWNQGSSTWAAFVAGPRGLKNTVQRAIPSRGPSPSATDRKRVFNYVALATLFVATIPLNGFLLQSAVTVATRTVLNNAKITVPMVDTATFLEWFLLYAAGAYDHGGVGPWTDSLWTNQLNDLIEASVDATVDLGAFNTGCLGNCSATVEGLGLAMTCVESREPFDIPVLPQMINETDTDGFTFEVIPGIELLALDPNYAPMFNEGMNLAEITITYNYTRYNRILFKSKWKDTGACSGDFFVQNCDLDLATVRYPVVINSQAKAVSKAGLQNATVMYLDLDPLSQNPEVVRLAPLTDDLGGALTNTAGLARFLAENLNSSISLKYNVDAYGGYDTEYHGHLAEQWYATQGEWHLPPRTICNSTTGNVAQKALALTRSTIFQLSSYYWLTTFASETPELYLRTGNLSLEQYTNAHTQRPVAQQTFDRLEYVVTWAWFFGTMAVTFTIVMFILPTFWGYWRLERKTTMSPFETARAFHAPVLYQQDSTVNSDALIKRVGHVQLHRDLPIPDPETGRFVQRS